MKQYTIYYSDEALDDIKTIYQYIAVERQEPTGAVCVVNRIRAYINDLYFFPSKYPQVQWSPWNELGIRNMLVKKYIVFYQIDETNQKVNILRIFSCKQDIPNIIKQQYQ